MFAQLMAKCRRACPGIFFSLKVAPSHGWSRPHLICGSFSPPDLTTQTASRSVQPFLHGSRLWQTDRLTDHTTWSVRIGHIYVRRTAMRPNNNGMVLISCFCIVRGICDLSWMNESSGKNSALATRNILAFNALKILHRNLIRIKRILRRNIKWDNTEQSMQKS